MELECSLIEEFILLRKEKGFTQEELAQQSKIIRTTIKELGGTMPEDLPMPKKSLKELEKETMATLIKKDN